jgi:hypothetical protein
MTGEAGVRDQVESAGCAASAAHPRLPCQESSSLNGRTNRKRLFAAQENMRGYVRRVGEDRIGVLTLTTADECRSLREFQRRWNSLMTNFVRRLWKSGVWVRERQMRTGNWHGHALVDVGFEIRPEFPFEEVANSNYRNVDDRVRDLWKQMREKAPRFGFGRTELLPIKSNSEWAIKYLTGYLGKALLSEKAIGEEKARLFGAWGCLRSVYSRFDWVSGRMVRKKKAWLSWVHDLADEEAVGRAYSNAWWFRLGESLMRVILPEDWYQVRRNGGLEWDDLGRQAYERDLQVYADLDSLESRRRQSRLDFFLAEAEWMGCDSTLQAMSYAMEVVGEIERRERQVNDEGEG